MAVSTTVQIKAEDKTKAAFRKINDRTSKLKKSFGGLAGAAVSLAGVAGLGALTSKILTLGDRIGKVAIQTGVAAEDLQKFQFAAEQSGVSTEGMNKALQTLAKRSGEVITEGGEFKVAFDRLNISLKDANGKTKDVTSIFYQAVDAISKLKSQAEKASAANDLFGRSGVELIPLLNAGSGAVENYGKQIEAVGGIIDKEAIQKIQEFNDRVNLLSKSFRGFLADSGTFEFLGKMIDGWTFGVQKLNEKFGDQEKKIRDINTISEELKITRKETALYQSQIEKSTGEEKKEAQERLKTNHAQVKTLQTELLSAEKIEGSVKDQEKAQTKVKKAIKATDAVAKELKKTVKPLMIAGKLDIPAIGGRQGLGGSLEKFTEFYLNLMVLAEDYLGEGFGVAGIVKKHLKTIKQDFTEMITGLQNQLVFRRNDISDAFADILNAIDNEMETKTWNAADLFTVLRANIAAADLFNITGVKNISASDHLSVSGTKSVKAADIFVVSGSVNIDLTNIENSTKASVQRSMRSVADYVNFYGVRSNYTPIGNASARKTAFSFGRNVNVDYQRAVPEDTVNFDYKTLYSTYPVMTGPGVTKIPGIYDGGRSSGRNSTSSGSNALENSGVSQPIEVSVYLDMEGQVKLPLQSYISSVTNKAERSGNSELVGILAG